MLPYLLRRLAAVVPVVLGVVLVVFVAVRLAPGDPAELAAGPGASRKDIERLRASMGLNDPLPVQFARQLGDLARGDLGRSYRGGRPVADEVLSRFPASLQLALGSLAISALLGIAAGIVGAVYRGRWIDHAITTVVIFGISMPIFWFGLVLIIVFALWLRWLPSSGSDTWQHFVLPAVTLSLSSVALVARMARSTMIDVLVQDYVRTARAKGLNPLTVVTRHALRNALIPIVTLLGLRFSVLMGGAVITETIFAWPGVGRLIVEAVKTRDLPIVTGGVLMVAVSVVFINLLVDLLYGWLDPRVKFG